MDPWVLAVHNFYKAMILDEIDAKMAAATASASTSTPAPEAAAASADASATTSGSTAVSASVSTPTSASVSSPATTSTSSTKQAEVALLNGPTSTQHVQTILLVIFNLRSVFNIGRVDYGGYFNCDDYNGRNYF
jgi:hypothetical protein